VSTGSILEFGALLRKFRKRSGLTQEELAGKAGITATYVSSIERGERIPAKTTAQILAEALDLTNQERNLFVDMAIHRHHPPSPLGERNYREDWGDAPHTRNFYGRDQELKKLKQWIVDDHCQMVAIIGAGGVGKTKLAAKMAHDIKYEFTHVFWRSLQNAPPLKNVLLECIQFFSDQQQVHVPEQISEQISLVVELLRAKRCLLILDNVESILQAGSLTGTYSSGYEEYGSFFRHLGEAQHESCLLLTSREKLYEVALLEGDALPIRSLRVEGLGVTDGQKILGDKGVRGSQISMDMLIRHYDGNPLALMLVSQYIQEVYNGDIASFLQDGEVVFSDIREVLDQQFGRLSLLEQEIIYWFSIEREPISPEDMQKNIVRQVPKREILDALRSLLRRSLTEKNDTGRVRLQNVVRDYVTDRFVNQVYGEIAAGTISLFESHALMKAQSKDYVRESQVRLILVPLAQRLLSFLGNEGLEKWCKTLLLRLREVPPHRQPGYTAGNVLNLLLQLGYNLRGYDFSYLTVWQAYLQDVFLRDINFAYADLAKSVFTDTFESVMSVAFSPKGDLLVAGTANGDVRIWRAGSGAPVHICRGHTDWIRSVSFSPDGTMIASGSEDYTLRLWQVSTGQCIQTLEGHSDTVWSATFSPDGNLIASASDDETIRLWQVSSGQCLKTLQDAADGPSVAFSPDGRIIASSCNQIIRLWRVDTGQCFKTLQGHSNRIWSVSFSPDGSIIASGGEDQTIRLWQVDTGQCFKTLQGHADMVWSVSFSPDGSVIASGGEDQTIRLWQVDTGQCFKTLQGYTDWIYSVAFSPDGNLVASGSSDQKARLWQVDTGQCLRTLQGFPDRVWSVAFSPDGKILASGTEPVQLWNVESGQCLQTLEGHGTWVYSVAFSPDGNLIASASDDATVRLWQVSTGQCLHILEGHPDWVWSVAFSPDGRTLASGCEIVRLWDVSTGQYLISLEAPTHQQIWSVAFSPDGTMLASGSDTVRLWNVETGQHLTSLSRHINHVRSVAFSPDGILLASGGEDQTVRLWDINTDRCLRILHGHIDWVSSIAFSPDGCIIASGSHDGTIKLWDVNTGLCLKTMRYDRPYERMNITNVRGLTKVQKASLKTLGAIEDDGAVVVDPSHSVLTKDV